MAKSKIVKELDQLPALMYYEMQGTKVPFEKLNEEEVSKWESLAVAALFSLSKMDKMIVKKVEQKVIEGDRNKNVNILTTIISDFVSNLKSIKCPKCGSTPEIRSLVFPSQELAFRIWDGGKK